MYIYHKPAKRTINLVETHNSEIRNPSGVFGFHCQMYPSSVNKILSTKIIVHLKPEETKSDVEELFAVRGVNVVQKFSFADNLYEVEVINKTFQNVIETCNAFQSDEMCIASQIQFLEQISPRS